MTVTSESIVFDVDGRIAYAGGDHAEADRVASALAGGGIRLVNLTPHVVNVLSAAGETRSIPPDGRVVRIAESDLTISDNFDWVRIVDRQYGGCSELPDPEPGTIYIVSLPALMALHVTGQHRDDVVAPDTGSSAIRESGKITAVCRFVRIANIPNRSASPDGVKLGVCTENGKRPVRSLGEHPMEVIEYFVFDCLRQKHYHGCDPFNAFAVFNAGDGRDDRRLYRQMPADNFCPDEWRPGLRQRWDGPENGWVDDPIGLQTKPTLPRGFLNCFQPECQGVRRCANRC